MVALTVPNKESGEINQTAMQTHSQVQTTDTFSAYDQVVNYIFDLDMGNILKDLDTLQDQLAAALKKVKVRGEAAKLMEACHVRLKDVAETQKFCNLFMSAIAAVNNKDKELLNILGEFKGKVENIQVSLGNHYSRRKQAADYKSKILLHLLASREELYVMPSALENICKVQINPINDLQDNLVATLKNLSFVESDTDSAQIEAAVTSLRKDWDERIRNSYDAIVADPAYPRYRGKFIIDAELSKLQMDAMACEISNTASISNLSMEDQLYFHVMKFYLSLFNQFLPFIEKFQFLCCAKDYKHTQVPYSDCYLSKDLKKFGIEQLQAAIIESLSYGDGLPKLNVDALTSLPSLPSETNLFNFPKQPSFPLKAYSAKFKRHFSDELKILNQKLCIADQVCKKIFADPSYLGEGDFEKEVVDMINKMKTQIQSVSNEFEFEKMEPKTPIIVENDVVNATQSVNLSPKVGFDSPSSVKRAAQEKPCVNYASSTWLMMANKFMPWKTAASAPSSSPVLVRH